MFVNTVLVPFKSGIEGGCESVEELHQRWADDILSHAMTPYDMVSSLGYGCNVYLAFNVGLIGKDTNGGNDGSAKISAATSKKMLYHDMLSEVVDGVDSSTVVDKNELNMRTVSVLS